MIRALAVLAALVAGTAAAKPPPQVIEAAAQSVVQVLARDCPGGRSRQGSGFLWPDAGRVVTALHVVADCGAVDVRYVRRGVMRGARVVRALLPADLAMLEVADAPDAQPFAHGDQPEAQAELAAVAVPAGRPEVEEFYGRIKVGVRPLARILTEFEQQSLRETGSPDLALEVFRLDAVFHPGMSGGPVIDAEGRVVGVVDGGVDGGNKAINWAVPAHHLATLRDSPETGAAVNLGRIADEAFAFSTGAAVAEAGVNARLVCGGREYFLLGERTLDEIAGSVAQGAAALDDPQGFVNVATGLAAYLPLDQMAALRFRLYVEEASGATIAAPAHMEVYDLAGLCVAEAAESDIGLIFRTASHDGTLMGVQAVSVEFENDMAAVLEIVGCAPDPFWTEPAPHTRPEDGLTARRGGANCQDVYQDLSFIGFAHIARGDSYTGVLAVNGDPELTPFDPTAIRDWSAAALALVISTYQL